MTTDKLPFPPNLPPLPEPSAGHEWVYRGKGWFTSEILENFITTIGNKWSHIKRGCAVGMPEEHYAEAVPIESPAEPDYQDPSYQKSILDAAWDGVPCQYLNPGNNCWIDEGDWHSVASSIAQGLRVRIKPMEPAKKRIPLTAEDIPAVCWVRFRVESPNVLIHSIDSCGVSYAGKEREHEVTFQELMRDGWEYSEDRRNWNPCCKETEE